MEFLDWLMGRKILETVAINCPSQIESVKKDCVLVYRTPNDIKKYTFASDIKDDLEQFFRTLDSRNPSSSFELYVFNHKIYGVHVGNTLQYHSGKANFMVSGKPYLE